jgi:hypothetical protein
MEGVYENATGDLIRWGDTDWASQPEFDAPNETVRTDIPLPPKVRFAPTQDGKMHRWNGSTWIEVDQPGTRGVEFMQLDLAAAVPGAPGADKLRFSLKQTGGKNQLVCEFPTGGKAHVATEP